MRTYKEESLSGFEFWSGAKQTAERLTDDDFETIEQHLEECYPEGASETQVNDFVWFEDDFIAELLGYGDWEELIEDRNN